jgi:hypothetical protein
MTASNKVTAATGTSQVHGYGLILLADCITLRAQLTVLSGLARCHDTHPLMDAHVVVARQTSLDS